MTCATCGHENRESARFCAQCGESLAAERACPECGTLNPGDARFCDACGTGLASAADPAAAARDPRTYTPDHIAEMIRTHASTLEGERKQVTVLFADVSGSMDLAEQTDPEAWRTIMDRFFAHLCEGVHRFEGTVVQFTGDGIMALFGAPIAHEDHAARAAYAALHLHRELSEYATELRREQGLNFSVRIGLNSGEVVVGAIGEDLRVNYTAIGHTVGLAQRMESLAEPGKAFVTEHTAALLAGFFELRDLGRFEVKGVREPVGVCELVGTGTARSRLDRSRARGFSRFVGRERELAALEEALDRALAGEGNVVGVVGEPGVGKSRLCDEFVERCRARGVVVYSAGGAAHARHVPFHAALEMLRGYFGVSDQDDPQFARERIAGRLLLLNPEFADELPLIFDFMGVPDPANPAPTMNPEARQRRLIDAVGGLVAAHAAREPAANLLEDLHWVDGGSQILLDALVRAAPGQRTLVVVNYRPEYRAEWMSLDHFTEVPLVPLGPEAIEALLVDLVGTDQSVDTLNEQIRQRTGGNPFFIEEVVQALAEEGTLEGERGAYRLTRPVESVSVPPTVHAVLAARIDRLDAGDKSLLQAAAVLGKEFGEPVLERVADDVMPSHPDLAAALRALVAAEFLYERALYPEAEYAFKHPLTQEVAYGSQLAERRRQVHAAVAGAMIDLYPDLLDERAALLAHHWEAAGETLEAARWHARAAAWAGVNDQAQAVAHWRKVVELAGALPESPETLALGVTARISVLQFGWRLGIGREESEALFEEGRALAERTGDEGMVALMVGSYAGILGIAGDMVTSGKLAADALARTRRAGNTFVEMAIMPFVSYTQLVSGAYRESIASCERIVELGDADPYLAAGVAIKSPYAWAFMMLGFLHAATGDVRRGRAELARSMELSNRYGDLETLGWAHMNHTLLAHWSGALEGALEHASRSVEIADSIGSAFSRVWAHFNLGVSSLMTGEVAAAVEELDLTRRLIHDQRTGLECEPWALSWLARARCEQDDPAAAIALIEEVLLMVPQRGTLNVFPFAYTNLARALRLRRNGPDDDARADAALAEAVAAARRSGAIGDQAHALVEQAELASARGDTEAADRWLREARTLFEGSGAEAHVRRLDERLAAASA